MAFAECPHRIIFDLDDIFTFTDRHFWYLIEWSLLQLRVQGDLSPERHELLVSEFKRLNVAVFATAGVTRERWQVIMDMLAPEFPELSEALQLATVATLSEIYTSAPELRPHALEMINQVAMLQYPLVILTHADEDATALKADTYGFVKWFNQIDSVSPTGSKNAAAWQACIAKAGSTPAEVIVVEDNYKNVLAALEAGVKNVIWHKGAECPAYGQKGEVLEGVHVITDLRQLAPLIQSIWP